MMQMPLLSYPQFSQFLQLQQEQQQLQQHYSRALLPVVQTGGLGMLSHRSGTSCSEASTGSPTPSPSPPLSVTIDNFPSGKGCQVKSGKSFTIDAILGIRDRDAEHMARDHARLLPNNFHPRLGLHLSGSKIEMPNNYGNGVDPNGSRLEACGRRIDVSRLSAVSREVLSFPLPTDLSSPAQANSGSTSNRRDLHHPSSFQSSSCPRLSEKSASDANKKCNGKSKRVRTIFTPEQLERLEAEFERQQYMVGPERLYLAHTLQLTEAQVKVWFQNRRIKWRKQHLEIQQQRLAAMKQQQRRSEEGDDSDDDSVDSNSYTFSADTNDNAGSGFYKSLESTPGLESVNLMQFQITNNEEDSSLFQEKDNASDSIKNGSASDVV